MANVTQFPTSPRERRRLLRRSQDPRLRIVSLLRILSGWAVLIFTILFVIINYKLFTPTNARNVSNYLRLGTSTGVSDLTTLEFPSGSSSDAVSFSGGLAFTDSDTLYIYSPTGITQLSEQLSYSNLSLCASQDRVLTYDRGGKGYLLTGSASIEAQGTLESPILSASISKNDSFALVTDEQGYKSAVTVYNAAGEQTYKWSSSEYYIQSAALSPSGKWLASLVFHASGVSPEGKLLIARVGQEDTPKEYALADDTLGFSISFLSEKAIAVVADTGIYLFHTSGECFASYAANADEMLAFAVTDDMIALATTSYHAGARSEVMVLQANGESIGPLYLTDELEHLALAEDRIAVLTAAGLTVYDADLQLLWSDTGAIGAKRILLQSNDLVYAIFSKNARLLTQHRSEEVVRTP